MIVEANNQENINKLLFTIIKERKLEQRWRLFNKFFLAFILLVMVLLLSNMNNDENIEKQQNHVAVVSLMGVIASGKGVGGEQTNAKAMVSLLEEAYSSPFSEAVIIDANSPGGSPVQSAIINDAIIRLKTKYNKPTIAVISDLCASGCYYVIAHVDKIIAHPSSIIGSIGVRWEGFDFRGLMDKIGVKQRLLTAGDNKALMNPFGEFKDESRTHIEKMIIKTHEQFINTVKSGRGDKLNLNDPDLFSGLVWLGAESKNLGLIDELGDLFSEVKKHSSNKIVRYEKEVGFVERFLTISEHLIFSTQNNGSLQLKF